MRKWYERGSVVEVVNGMQTRFWQDCWLGECPLKIQFHSLYQISSNPDIEVAKVDDDGQWIYSSGYNLMNLKLRNGADCSPCWRGSL